MENLTYSKKKFGLIYLNPEEKPIFDKESFLFYDTLKYTDFFTKNVLRVYH